MNYIIFDVEATCWEGSPLSEVQEIIEIGAVMLNEYGEELGSYNRFIQPIINPTLSIFCKRLTSIQQSDVDRAKKYPTVIEEFQDWAEIFDEEYLLCSWGDFDRKILISNCDLHNLEWEWVEQHINVKEQYRALKRLNRARGLKAAVKAEGFEFTGIQHRGISDAENLAKIFAKHIDEWIY